MKEMFGLKAIIPEQSIIWFSADIYIQAANMDIRFMEKRICVTFG